MTKSCHRRNNAFQAEDVLRFPLEENSFFKKVVIMKKTLAAVAVLGAFAGSALAADVTLYGIVDLGVGYTQSDDGENKTDKVAMKSGMDSASRVGFIATEQIGDVTVGVKLENSFSADTGADGQATLMDGSKKNSFFNRETRLFVQGTYGEVGFGRFGALDSTTGPYNLAGSRIHGTTGVNDIGDTGVIFLGQNSRVENSIAYKSPEFAGARLFAQYATQEGEENTHKGDRYYGLGLTYELGAFQATLVGSYEDGNDTPADDLKGEETKAYTAAVAYDFGVTTLKLAGQYFDNAYTEELNSNALKFANGKGCYVDGYGLTVSAVTPLFGGKLVTQVGYMEAEAAEDSKVEFDAWNIGALYYYNFSKRTSVYGGLGYTVQGVDVGYDGYDFDDVKTLNAALGMIHKF